MTAHNHNDLAYPHPGEILKTEFLDELGITQYRLAVDTKIPHSRVTAIIKGRRSVSADTALRLARYFGNSPEFWLGLQQDYDLWNLQEAALSVKEEIAPYGAHKRADGAAEE
ncbi:MAG: HigA family addiction module antidote protein [Verrucomicrobia bacterium]|jgi:addiction module HigA family antidote|nr:HigA family addiction module antidote protein [Verrucomicrobiota bacterium]